LGRLEADGTPVTYGIPGNGQLTLPLGVMLGKGRAQLRGLNLYAVTERARARKLLERVLALVEAGRIRSDFEVAGSWHDIGLAATALMDRKVKGKVVLSVT
jgi:NADPH:quinone reductase-like Zn-dependent oxidoreductase